VPHLIFAGLLKPQNENEKLNDNKRQQTTPNKEITPKF